MFKIFILLALAFYAIAQGNTDFEKSPCFNGTTTSRETEAKKFVDEAILLAEKFNETEGFGSKYQLFKTSCEQIYEKLLSADKITFSPECVEDPSGNKKFSKRLEIIKEFFGTNCNMDLVTYTAFIDEVTVQPKLDSIVDKCSYLIDTVVLSPTQRYDNYCSPTRANYVKCVKGIYAKGKVSMEYYNHRFDVTIKLFCDKPLTNEEYDEKFTVISSFNLNYYKALVLMAGMEV